MSAPLQIRWSVETLDTMEAERTGWARLAREALEPNPFYEPDYLLASRALGEGRATRLLVARDALQPQTLLALWPLRKAGWREGWSGQLMLMAQNAFTPLTAPLVQADNAAAVLDSLLDEAPRLFPGTALLLPLLAVQRPFWQLWQARLVRRGVATLALRDHTRAAIEFAGQAADADRHIHRTLQRRARKLATHGRVHYVVVEGGTAAGDAMLQTFLAIEAKGWKGRRRTALASRPATLAFARQALAGHGPTVLYECILLNDQPLAINLNLLAGGVLYTLKSAYDEDFRHYSPGSLLDLHTIDLASAGGPVTRVDSCALPGHPLEQRWRQRERIAAQLVDWTGTQPAEALARRAHRLTRIDHAVQRLSAWRARWQKP